MFTGHFPNHVTLLFLGWIQTWPVCTESSTWEHSFAWIKAFIKDLNLNQFAVTQEKWIIMKNRQTIMGITTRDGVRSSQLGELLKTPGLFPHRRGAETGTDLAANDGNYTPPPGFSVLPMLSYSLIKTSCHYAARRKISEQR